MTVRLILGDALTELRKLPADSVHCVVTSPPYFGLRDYGVAGQIGLEPTPDAYVAVMVEVFREVRRVLRKDGTLWLNLGDSYAAGPMTQRENDGERSGTTLNGRRGHVDNVVMAQRRAAVPAGLKPKDLIGIPWRVAFALQADGWYLRQDIIWAKPNPMPESVTDRCTKAHEYLFLISKSARYHYDAEAIAEALTESSVARLAQDVDSQQGSERVPGKTNGTMKAVSGAYGHGAGRNDGDRHPSGGWTTGETKRNRRSVWTVATQPFAQAHFATFPPDLIEPCIKAGCPKGGTVLDPFGGAGTTGLVADRLQRDAILIELNPAYAAMAESRILGDAPLFVEMNAGWR
jgi:DNA modification methylase